MRPVAGELLVLTSASCVAHPPPIANCGRTIASAPPMMPGVPYDGPPYDEPKVRIGNAVTVPVLPAASVVKFAPANGKPRIAKGKPIWRLIMPINSCHTESDNN